MDYLDLEEELDKIEISGDWGRVIQIMDMKSAFPDLKVFRDCYGRLAFCSQEANRDVDKVEMDSCHETNGQPLTARPFVFLDKHGAKLYSEPPHFVVATQNPRGFGEIPLENWEQALVTAKVNIDMIRKIRDHLLRHQPISYLEADDEERRAKESR